MCRRRVRRSEAAREGRSGRASGKRAARMRDGRCRRACEGHRRGEAKRGVPPLLRKGRGRLHGTKGMRLCGVHAAERAEEKTPPIGDSEGKACGRRRRKELRPEKRTVVFRSGRALQQDFSRSVISSTSGTPRPLASFSMVASVGGGRIASFQLLKILIVHPCSLSQVLLRQAFGLSQVFQCLGETKVNGFH